MSVIIDSPETGSNAGSVTGSETGSNAASETGSATGSESIGPGASSIFVYVLQFHIGRSARNTKENETSPPISRLVPSALVSLKSSPLMTLFEQLR